MQTWIILASIKLVEFFFEYVGCFPDLLKEVEVYKYYNVTFGPQCVGNIWAKH